RLSVHVDAAVTVPDAEGFRLKKVSSRSFTQADSDAVSRVLLDGGALLDDGVLRERETMPGRAAYSVSLDNGLTPDRREISFLVMREDTQIGFPLLTDTGTETLPDPQALTDQAVSSLAGMEIAGFQPADTEYVSVSRQDFTGTVLERHNGVRIPFERMVDGIP